VQFSWRDQDLTPVDVASGDAIVDCTVFSFEKFAKERKPDRINLKYGTSRQPIERGTSRNI
jgi:hypothetical protein